MTPAALFLLAVMLTGGAILAALPPSSRDPAKRRHVATGEQIGTAETAGGSSGAGSSLGAGDLNSSASELSIQAPTTTSSAARHADEALSAEQILTRLHCLALGVEELGSPPAEHAAVGAAVADLIGAAAGDPRYALRRPRLLPQLLHLANDDETSRNQLAEIIAQDPALVGGLLRIANSPFYRVNTQPVESIDRALALLGTDGLRSLVAAAVVQPVFRVGDRKYQRFPLFAGYRWEHTARSAVAAQAHAAFADHESRLAGQLLALLAGLGAIVVFRIVLDVYDEHHALIPDPAVLATALDTHAARAAADIAASWEVSGRIREALDQDANVATASEGGVDSGPSALGALGPLGPLGPLGQSLRFGRLIGALSMLHENGLVDEETAMSSLVSAGAHRGVAERTWARLRGPG